MGPTILQLLPTALVAFATSPILAEAAAQTFVQTLLTALSQAQFSLQAFYYGL